MRANTKRKKKVDSYFLRKLKLITESSSIIMISLTVASVHKTCKRNISFESTKF